MPDFRSMGEINRFLNTLSGQSYIQGIQSVKTIILQEANRLKNLIQKYIDEYYNSYDPSIYERTYGLQNSLRVDDIVKINTTGNVFSVEIFFDNDSAYSPSLFNEGEYGYKPALINYGWQVKKDVWFKDIAHFGYYEGFHFIEKAIAEFNSTNRYNLKVEIIRNR